MVVDDLESIREHFCTLVSECADMTLVCEAESGREAIERAKSAKPDIILMDIQLEDESAGIRATERIKEIMPDAKVIILTVHNNDKFMMDAYLAGASDYILKYDDGANIFEHHKDGLQKNDFFLGPLLAKKS
ncbi:MAG: response regulator transcription factor [Clostridiales bacterium]|nr:MAG: response regulator transcription factor [Clostridiales bacterium]